MATFHAPSIVIVNPRLKSCVLMVTLPVRCVPSCAPHHHPAHLRYHPVHAPCCHPACLPSCVGSVNAQHTWPQAPPHAHKLHTHITTGSFACHIHAHCIHAPAHALHPLPAHSTHVPPSRTCTVSPPSSFAASPLSSCAMSRCVTPLTHVRYPKFMDYWELE